MVLFCVQGSIAQESQVPSAISPGASQSENAKPTNPESELDARDEVTTFKVKVNLVLVRVVVRDGKGSAVGNLRQEDFQLYDNGKLQTIRQFSVENPYTKREQKKDEATSPVSTEAAYTPEAPIAPNHFVAYVFDDVHLSFGDLVRLRDAASRHLKTLQPTDRAAIFTTSGLGNLDFTDDHDALQKALDRLRPNAVSRDLSSSCPDISYYQADLIQNKQDAEALSVATAETLACAFNNDTRYTNQANTMAQSEAARVLGENEHESRLALSVFHDILRRIAAVPGQRTMLVLSPGFLTSTMEQQYIDLIDQALRSQIVISSLNGRGLYTVNPIGDVSKPIPLSQSIAIEKLHYEEESNREEEDVLADLAYGTGGSYYHNSNDFDAGFNKIASALEFYYILAFTPQNLKLDGSFHRIKVQVKNPPKLDVQARKGYYAPKHAADPNQEAKDEIEEALFSQDELHDLPVDLHTQFFKPTDDAAQLAVLVHIDARHLHFVRQLDRNVNQLTIVSGLFDRNGRFISANQKVLDLHLRDETLARRLDRGITLKSNFDVKPGGYLVRLVVRDAGGQISAANGTIEIP